jgi:hypothetical protein
MATEAKLAIDLSDLWRQRVRVHQRTRLGDALLVGKA